MSPEVMSPGALKRSFNSSTIAPPIAGIASRNEKRAQSAFFKFTFNPAAIVEPERDIPGVIATACATLNFLLPPSVLLTRTAIRTL